MAETTYSGLKYFIGVSVKVSGLEGPVVDRQQLQRKLAALCMVAAVLWLQFSSAELVG